jgi:hypothetical protein
LRWLQTPQDKYRQPDPGGWTDQARAPAKWSDKSTPERDKIDIPWKNEYAYSPPIQIGNEKGYLTRTWLRTTSVGGVATFLKMLAFR